MVVRRDVNVESLGTMAQLPPDLSPLQIGTRGVWMDKPFEILGRLRVNWDDGNWNEWFAIFENRRTGWIAEAQGIFTVAFALGEENLPGSPGQYRAGQSLHLASVLWTVTDVKRTTGIAGEGELPFVATPGMKRIGIDMNAIDGSFASVEFVDGAEPQFYKGAYAEFDDLKFSNLRPVPGWSSALEAQPGAGALSCPNCGAAIHLRAVGQSVAAVCGSCGSIIDAANPQLRLIAEADARIRAIQPVLPLGTRGKLFGTDYEIIGYMERGDQYATWAEYLLFNPWKGFRWLVTYAGHWTFVERLFRTPCLSGMNMILDQQRFDLFARASAVVQSVLGEFYWKVKRGEECVASDYIAPPRILSSEKYPELEEVTWSRGEYIEPAVVSAAFGVKKLRTPSGVYLNQPNPFRDRWRRVRLHFALFIGALALVQWISCALVPTKSVYSGDFTFERGGASTVLVSPHFQIDGGRRAVTIEATAPVDNNWLGMDATLVSAKDSHTYPAELSIEYYHGVEDGESWNEGNGKASVTLPAIPPGEYYLSLDTDADPAIQKMAFHVQAASGAFFPSNWILAFVLLAIYPVYLWWRQRRFEHERWEQSDFLPPGLKFEVTSNDED